MRHTSIRRSRWLALALLGLVGCPGGPQRIQILPGYPVLGEAQVLRSGRSGLVVLTGTWTDLNLGSPDEGTQIRHTGYSLYEEHGVFLQYVRNYIGSTDTEATTIELEPGRYLVLLDRPEKQPPVFWVRVEPGKVTTVTLPR